MKIIRHKINTNRKKLIEVTIEGTVYKFIVPKKTPVQDVVDKLTDSIATKIAHKSGGTVETVIAHALFIKALLEETAEVNVYAE